MTVLPLLSLISRNSPKQLGMVSPEPEAACHSSGRIRQLPQIQAASGSYTLQVFQASQGFTAFLGILLHLLPQLGRALRPALSPTFDAHGLDLDDQHPQE